MNLIGIIIGHGMWLENFGADLVLGVESDALQKHMLQICVCLRRQAFPRAGEGV